MQHLLTPLQNCGIVSMSLDAGRNLNDTNDDERFNYIHVLATKFQEMNTAKSN